MIVMFYVRPDVESLVMPREGTKEGISERPLASIMVVYELVILQITRQLIELHQPPSHSRI